MAGLVLSRETVDTALHLVTELARTATTGTMGAGVTVVDEHGKRSRAASDQVAEQADALQYELDEGPCLTAWRTREPVRIDDITTDARWPRWTDAVQPLGVRSMLSAPLLIGMESIGAMKVYSQRPANYGPTDEHIMRLLAGQAAILLANSQSLREARRLESAAHRGTHESGRRRPGHRCHARPRSGESAGGILGTGRRGPSEQSAGRRGRPRHAGRRHGPTSLRRGDGAYTVSSDDRHLPVEAARIRANLTVQELWLSYVALGGTSDAFDVDGYLQGLVPLDTFQQDVLAQAVNEELAEIHRATQVPLSTPATDEATRDVLERLVAELLQHPPRPDDVGADRPRPEASEQGADEEI